MAQIECVAAVECVPQIECVAEVECLAEVECVAQAPGSPDRAGVARFGVEALLSVPVLNCPCSLRSSALSAVKGFGFSEWEEKGCVDIGDVLLAVSLAEGRPLSSAVVWLAATS